MKYRKLRIAWSVAWGVACLLLIALWVRSYWYHLHLSYVGAGQATVFAAQDGEFTFGRTFGRSEGPVRWSFIFAPIRPFGISTGPNEIRPEFYAFRRSDSYGIGIPVWFTVLLAAMLTALSWLRFSLRTLLIAMTVIAIGLAWIVRGCQREVSTNHVSPTDGAPPGRQDSFVGARAGEERQVGGARLCWCPPGRFRMGSPPAEPGHRADETQVEVTLSQGFWTGKHEVTQAEWRQVAGELPGIVNADVGDDFPVYSVSFSEAEEFCHQLSEQARASGELPEGWEFRLPTEAQWEYACRAGSTTAFSFGESLSSANATFGKPYNGTPTGVPGSASSKAGSYAANAWGLCDMHGNEWEWCRDWYHAQLPGGVDPDLYSVKGLPNRDGSFSRVRRGGAWVEAAEFCRSAVRLRYEPERRADHIGFRVIACRP